MMGVYHHATSLLPRLEWQLGLLQMATARNEWITAPTRLRFRIARGGCQRRVIWVHVS